MQLTSDGDPAYLKIVPEAFNNEIDFAILMKTYGPSRDKSHEARYSPPKINGTKTNVVLGMPDKAHISTSFAERNNINIRMGMRRFTRLTNAFSKKFENLQHAAAVQFVHHNFVRVHQALKTAPAIAAGIANRRWTIKDMIALLDEPPKKARKVKTDAA